MPTKNTVPRTTQNDLWIVASTLFGEAANQGPEGQEAVAWVIRNRQTLHPRWRSMTLQAICQQAYQFSCWLSTDVNRAKLIALSLETPGFSSCLLATIRVLTRATPCFVGKATHYYADTITAPAWARGKTPVVQIGHHLFFEDIT